MIFPLILLYLLIIICLLLIDRKHNNKQLTEYTLIVSKISEDLSYLTKDINSQIQKLYFLLDTLHMGIPNEMSKAVYSNLRNSSPDKIPKNSQEAGLILQKISDQQFEKAVLYFKEQIKHSESQEETDFYSSKLSKLQEMRTISQTIDENSSPEFINLINQELFKSMIEFNSHQSGENL